MAKKICLKGPILDNDTSRLYDWIGWQSTCPAKLERALNSADGEDVILEVNSPGGYCDYGFEMYTLLKEYPGNVEAHIICAASAMTVVCCAADRCLISDAGMYMVHNTHGGGDGDYRDMINIAECLEEYNESAINVYVRRTGKSREELKDIMDHTTWMSPKKAIEEGFVDDYLFGNPDEDTLSESDHSQTSDPALVMGMIMNSSIPVLDRKKVEELTSLMKLSENGALMEVGKVILSADQKVDGGTDLAAEIYCQKSEKQILSEITDSDTVTDNQVKPNEEGGKHMSLEELLADNPEAKAEFEAHVQEAINNATKAENTRLHDLDAICASVPEDALYQAKYGENPLNAKELAFQVLMEDGKKAENYMAHAIEDAKQSGVDDVGPASPKGESAENETSDWMANYVNAKKGVK